MADTSVYSYDDKIKDIDHIDFAIFGNDEISRISALGKDNPGIEVPDLYENLEPKKGGLIDPRLGPVDNTMDCATCGLNNTECVGHFGHIELAEPLFHIGYLNFVKKILGCICIKCSKLLIYKNEEEIKEILKTKSDKSRMNYVRNIVKNVTICQQKYNGCGTPVAKIREESRKKTTTTINIIAETDLTGVEDGETTEFKKKTNRFVLTPDLIYDIFKNISDTDCMIMGIDPKKSRPEMMILKTFPVPPVQIRPSARVDYMSSSMLQNDLTIKLADIVKKNIALKKQKETMNDTTAKYLGDLAAVLQFHVATYINNEIAGFAQSEQKGKVLKSLISRLKGKEGRIRWNLMGKRGDFCARTVITSDPTISINEVGVPIKIAMNLTFPEIVTPENIKYLTKLVQNGADKYPGAKNVFQAHTTYSIDLRYRKVDLNYGDIVERHLINGDPVLLNRQPTLHKQSMMCHKIKVITDPAFSTFRLSVTVTKPYNADFDENVFNVMH